MTNTSTLTATVAGSGGASGNDDSATLEGALIFTPCTRLAARTVSRAASASLTTLAAVHRAAVAACSS